MTQPSRHRLFGSSRINVKPRFEYVSVRAVGATLVAQDQGKGIREEHLEKIFNPYFSTKAMGVQKGTGLGLATAYAIVQKHGGYIAISSSPGAGTTVNIYLPAESRQAESEIKTLPQEDSASSKKQRSA